MKNINILEKTHSIIIHSPGFSAAKILGLGLKYYYRKNPLWVAIQKRYKKSKPQRIKPKEMENLTIITWNNSTKKGILEKCLDRMGAHYLVLGKGIKEWKHIYKLHLTCEALNNIKTKYVMGLDSYDVLLLDSPREALDRFKSFSCKMLFNASTRFYPNCHRFEGAKEHFITRDWENFQSSLSNSHWKYLNGGAWMGETSFCRKFFADCSLRKTKKLVDTKKLPSQKEKGPVYQNITDSEQTVLHWAFKDYFPQVQLDYDCKIFLNPPGRDRKGLQ